MKTAFIGHRQIFVKDVYERIINAVQTEIELGCVEFIMGKHDDFDKLALNVCKHLRKIYKNLDIEVAITSLHALKRNNVFGDAIYADVKTVMYDIDNVHYKRQITLSNKLMIDDCDTLICYVDTSVSKSGAKSALRYAEKVV